MARVRDSGEISMMSCLPKNRRPGTCSAEEMYMMGSTGNLSNALLRTSAGSVLWRQICL